PERYPWLRMAEARPLPWLSHMESVRPERKLWPISTTWRWNEPVIPRIELVDVLVFASLNVGVHGAELFLITYDVVHRVRGFILHLAGFGSVAGHDAAVNSVDAVHDFRCGAWFLAQRED